MRPNVLAWAVGIIIIAAGVLVAARGVMDVIDVSGPKSFREPGATALADAVSGVIWGVMILTIGCYVWRAARRRGWKDRSGRVLISVGYLVLAFGMSEAVHSAVGLWASKTEAEAQSVMLESALLFVGFGFVAALLIRIGTKMSDEIVITTAEWNVNT
jgi:hypothetical protein